jgi:hypothetical protein
MMDQRIADALAEEQQPQDVVELLDYVKELLRLSRAEMNKYYDQWEANDMVYRGLRIPDDKDKAAQQRKEPVKVVMPVSKAQISTFVSFFMEVLNQKDYFYELGGTGIEDEGAAKIGQMVLEQNLEWNNFRHQKLKQFGTDLAKYGVGIFRFCWTTKKRSVVQMTKVPQPVAPGMVPPPPLVQRKLVPVVEYQGNMIQSVTPFHFFPDPRLPLTRFQEGEFCASEDEYSRSQLKLYEKQGDCVGIQWVPEFKKEMEEGRRSFGFMSDTSDAVLSKVNQKQTVIVTEIQVWLNPTEYTVNGQPLDKERDELVRYLIWYANDNRIIRLEPYDYPYAGFGYAVAQFEEDQINFINDGMADVLQPMQDVIDWLINSRITSVRKVIGNQLIVDPKGIEIDDLRQRKPVLRLKPGVQGMGVDKWVKQLPLQDVTTAHLQDVSILDGYSKSATGITENLLGQFASGRRSAREAMNVNSNAVARVMAIVKAVWASALLPLGRQMLDNIRAGMDVPVIVRVIGVSGAMENQQGLFAFKQVTPDQIVGNYDFLLFDGTLPSQRAAMAQGLQELLTVMLSNPEVGLLLGYNPTAIVAEILELRGIRNANRFKLSPQQAIDFIKLAQAGRNAMASTGTPSGAGGGNDGGNQQPARNAA